MTIIQMIKFTFYFPIGLVLFLWDNRKDLDGGFVECEESKLKSQSNKTNIK